MRQELQKQLELEEKKVRHAYQDHLGYLTIGIGRLIDERKGGGLSEDEIQYLFNNDINKRIDELHRRLPWFQNLDDVRKGVLINMSFQMGVDGLLKFKNTLKQVELGNYGTAAAMMLVSLWAGQTPARANRMSKQMRTGIWQYKTD
jgi:lysozyme